MFKATSSLHGSRGAFRRAIAAMTLTAIILVTVPARAQEAAPDGAERRFTVMTYNVYLGANLQPLFDVQDPLELIRRAAAVFAHLDRVDFRVRAVAIAEQIIENAPDVVALQEVSLWQTAPISKPTMLTTRYDFLETLLEELERQGHTYEAVVVNETFNGQVPINLTPPTLGVFTDRNVVIVRSDVPASELMTSNAVEGVYDAAIPLLVGGTRILLTRGWAAADIMIPGKTNRFVDTHLEGFSPLVRTGQVNELVQIMSTSPYPVVLAGDLNLFPQSVRPVDSAAWALLAGEGFVDAWARADCFEPRYTAGQTDDLDNVPSTLDNTVDYVLYDADLDIEAVEGSCDVAGEELDDRTNTAAALWPSDHAAVVVAMHIGRP